MRFLPLLLLLSIPHFISADCGDCDSVHKQLERERKKDAELQGCRSCKKMETSEKACPSFGYDCSVHYGITINGLAPNNPSQCAVAKCAGPFAKLAIDGTIVNRVRCNDSQWLNGKEPAGPAICAKPCNSGACKASLPSASSDYTPLQVTPATVASSTPCAAGKCENGMVALNADGSLKHSLDTLTGIENVICSGDGVWEYGKEKHKHVMCNASPCGPSKCKAFKFGEPMTKGEVVPLTVTGNGKACATATCQGDYYEINSSDGSLGELLDMKGKTLTCNKDDGMWNDGSKSYEFVMCKLPPCDRGCNGNAFVSDKVDISITPAIGRGCSYSCADDTVLVRQDPEGAVSIDEATCEGGKFRINNHGPVQQIGCTKCSTTDETFTWALSEMKPLLVDCVLMCPDDNYVIDYVDKTNPNINGKVNRLHFLLFGQARGDSTRPEGRLYDSSKGRALPSEVEIRCVPK